MTDKKNIIKITRAKFKVITPDVKDSELILDFNPLIKKFRLSGNYQLFHWQAKPRYYREWGVYKSGSDSYHSISGFVIQGVFKIYKYPIVRRILFLQPSFYYEVKCSNK